jgi:nucleotide-binding universal stress UspA family protein
MPRIVVGIDGSHHSTRAIEWALKEAALQQAQLTALTAHRVPASPWTGNRSFWSDQENPLHAAEELTHKVTSQLGESRPQTVTVRPSADIQPRNSSRHAGTRTS